MIALFQHGSGEPPGYILDLIRNSSTTFGIITPYETGEVPDGPEATHMIFLGGQMSVNDEKEFPWLLQEKHLIRKAVRSGTPVLGICLGAQLIASALGKNVYPCREERGWCKIRRNISGSCVPGDDLTVFQWHGESFDLPDGGRLVCTGDQVQNQMFTLGSATGVQFHPEVTGEIIDSWCKSAGQKQSDEIISQTPRFIGMSNQICKSIFNGFICRG